MPSICFVWILPLLQVDPVQKDGVSVEFKANGVVVISFEEIGSPPSSEEQSLVYRVILCFEADDQAKLDVPQEGRKNKTQVKGGGPADYPVQKS